MHGKPTGLDLSLMIRQEDQLKLQVVVEEVLVVGLTTLVEDLETLQDGLKVKLPQQPKKLLEKRFKLELNQELDSKPLLLNNLIRNL